MQLNRMSKIAIGVAAACALYSAGGFWGVPALMKWAAEGPATEALGRKVSIEKAEFNPWTLEATVHNIAMADQAGANPALSIGRVYVNTAFALTNGEKSSASALSFRSSRSMHSTDRS